MKFFLLSIFIISFEVNAKGIIGQSAPEINDLKWFNHQGKKVAIRPISDHRGKVVIIKFWQSWCPGCLNKGLPDLKKLQDHFKNNKNVKIYSAQTVFEGFSTNTKNKLKKIRDKYGLIIPMAHDDGKSHNAKQSVLMERYKARGTPWYVIVAPDGKVVFNDFHLRPKKTIKFIEEELLKNQKKTTKASQAAQLRGTSSN